MDGFFCMPDATFGLSRRRFLKAVASLLHTSRAGRRSLGAFTPLSAAGGVRPGVYAGFAVLGHPRICDFLPVTPVYGRPARRAGGRPVNGPDKCSEAQQAVTSLLTVSAGGLARLSVDRRIDCRPQIWYASFIVVMAVAVLFGSPFRSRRAYRATSSASQAWFYVGRASGGDHDHRHPDCAVAAGGAGGPRGGAAGAVPEQPQATRAWAA